MVYIYVRKMKLNTPNALEGADSGKTWLCVLNGKAFPDPQLKKILIFTRLS